MRPVLFLLRFERPDRTITDEGTIEASGSTSHGRYKFPDEDTLVTVPLQEERSGSPRLEAGAVIHLTTATQGCILSPCVRSSC